MEALILGVDEAKPQEIMRAFRKAWEQGKPHFIVVAAEGAPLSAEDIHRYINDTKGAFKSRLTVLGHVQRGESPTALTGYWLVVWERQRLKRYPKRNRG